MRTLGSCMAALALLAALADAACSKGVGCFVPVGPRLSLRASAMRSPRSPLLGPTMKTTKIEPGKDDEGGFEDIFGSKTAIENTLSLIKKAMQSAVSGSQEPGDPPGMEEAMSDVAMSKEMIQEEVSLELEKARNKLARSAMRVAALQQRADQLRGPQEMSEESEDDDDETLPEDEELAFQMGFNSLEYVAGTGTVTITRKGPKTILTVEDKGASKEGWIKTVTSFVSSLVEKKADVQSLADDEEREGGVGKLRKRTRTLVRERPAAEQAEKEGEGGRGDPKEEPNIPQLRLPGVVYVWRAWYGNPKYPWRTRDSMLSAVQGKDVTERVRKFTKAEEGLSVLLIPATLNQDFGDPVYGVEKDLMVDVLLTDGRNATAVWSENRLRTEPKLIYHDDNYPHGPNPALFAGKKKDDSKDGALSKGDTRSEKSDGDKSESERRKEKVVAAAQGAGEDGGNVTDLRETQWWRQVLWGNGTMGAKELQKEVAKEAAKQEKKPKPPLRTKPPPVIPFIKYASPGPPVSEWTKDDCTQPYFRILSLDGGGVRGVLSTVILQRIVQEVPSFMDNVDMIAGTSTGGLIALMLAAGYSPVECQEIYEYGCPKIFAKDPWRVYNPTNAKYTAKGREELCRTYLGDDRTLKDLKKHVVITAFRLDGKVGNMGAFITRNGGWRPAVFSNIPKLQGDLEPDLNLYAWDAALRTSAAPTYFPVHRGYVDGAMFQNNPSMLGVTKACAHFPRVSPDNTVVLSVGAGNYPLSIPRAGVEDLDWGIKDWVPYIFDLMLDGDSLSCEVLMRYMLGGEARGSDKREKRYHRIDPALSTYMEMDDVDRIPELIELGKSIDLTETIQFAQTHFSSSPTASEAFSQAAVRTANWAAEQAAKVQLSDVVRSLTSAPSSIPAPWMGYIPKLEKPPEEEGGQEGGSEAGAGGEEKKGGERKEKTGGGSRKSGADV